MNRIYDEIYDYIKELEIIDTHEHLAGNEADRDKENDILSEYLKHYFSCDLVSAGLKKEDLDKVKDSKKPLMDRWKMVEPYWELARHTGYGRSLDITVKGLYNIDRIDGTTIQRLNELYLETLKGGQYRFVLKEKSKIKTSLVDSCLDCDRTFFRSVFRLDNNIAPTSYESIKQVMEIADMPIKSFDDWIDASEKTLDYAYAKGAVSLKSGLAYLRSIRYEETTYDEAKSDFNNYVLTLISEKKGEFSIDASKKMQDYMMHHVLSLANKRNLTYQFHTGLQEGNGNIISNSEPSLMSNLFIKYSDVKFDIFHIGYPYQHVMSALSKNFQNVFIDMCWAHIISPTASINSLVEWLDSVPYNKISAFGGDYCFIDAVYGHQFLARQNVAKALTIKVMDGVFDADKAKEISKMLFYTNPMKIFNL